MVYLRTARIIHFVLQVIKILSGNLGTVELKTEPLPYAGESHLPHDAGGPTIPGTFIETGWDPPLRRGVTFTKRWWSHYSRYIHGDRDPSLRRSVPSPPRCRRSHYSRYIYRDRDPPLRRGSHYSFIHSFIYSSFIHSFVIHSSFIHSFIHSFIKTLIHLFIFSFRWAGRDGYGRIRGRGRVPGTLLRHRMRGWPATRLGRISPSGISRITKIAGYPVPKIFVLAIFHFYGWCRINRIFLLKCGGF